MPAAVVTGAGTGIGAAIARRLARDGYAVALVGRRRAPLDQVARELTGAAVVTADVGRPEDAERAVADAVAAFGGLDLLVNNAGTAVTAAVLDDTPEGWDALLRTNLTGAFLMSRAALPHLLERGGSIVNVASVSGLRAGPGWASYCTSKAGLIMLTQSIAHDYGRRGVRANCVCPGWVRTAMADADMDELARIRSVDRDGAYALATEHVPLARPGEPDEVAGVVAFLASPDAAYVNGVSLPIDGGATVVDVAGTAYTARS